MLDIRTKSFSELNTKELYMILQLRSEVFVVEQQCIYQDIDNKDEKALHVLGFKDNRIVAYTRIFKPGAYFDQPSIGRVAVSENERSNGFGYQIMKASIQEIEKRFKRTEIKISAQTYLKDFYNNLNFYQVGNGYMEDGIPHIAMIKK
jgi:ElaA protein